MRDLKQLALAAFYTTGIAGRNTWWRIRRPLLMGVRVLLVRDHQVLLVRHRSGALPWSLPGGGVERCEPLAAAAIRECREEAGATVQIERIHGAFDNFFLGTSNYVTVFVATQVGERTPFFSFEVAEARYFPVAALPANIEQGSARRVTEYCEGRTGVAGAW